MSERPYAGYPGRVWATCYQAITWLNGLLSPTAAAAQTVGPAGLVFTLLRNASETISAWQASAGLAQEVINMDAIEALSITLDPTTTTYFNARVAAILDASIETAALLPVPNPSTVVAQLQSGQSNMLYSGYLDWCLAFTDETPPAGLTPITLPTFAQAAAAAWLNVANAISILQGNMPTSAYDTAARMYRCSQIIANLIAQLQSGPFQSATVNDWNGVVALPAILLDASTLATSPASLQAQQAAAIKYALDTTADQLAIFLTANATYIVSEPQTATLANTDTLQDLAARVTGQVENWVAIAKGNNLSPPYPGPTNQAIALSGRSLYMPGSNVALGANQQPLSYPDGVMKTDYDFGPINGAQPPWTGDIKLITGYQNFARAIGRRIQTPLGTLIYHNNYGSRIPGEVGAIQSQDESARLAAFGERAIESDPRTGRILSIVATLQPGFLATFDAKVQPKGPGSTPQNIKESVGQT